MKCQCCFLKANLINRFNFAVALEICPDGCFQYPRIMYYVLSSSRTRVRVKLGLFNAKIRNENHGYIHRLIYQFNEQDLLCHSI